MQIMESIFCYLQLFPYTAGRLMLINNHIYRLSGSLVIISLKLTVNITSDKCERCWRHCLHFASYAHAFVKTS